MYKYGCLYVYSSLIKNLGTSKQTYLIPHYVKKFVSDLQQGKIPEKQQFLTLP
jgi:hypothetical protein